MYRTEKKRGLRVIYGKAAVVHCWCLRFTYLSRVFRFAVSGHRAWAAKNENYSIISNLY